MKPRRVIVTLDLETDMPLDILRNKYGWQVYLRDWYICNKVIQAQANIVKKET